MYEKGREKIGADNVLCRPDLEVILFILLFTCTNVKFFGNKTDEVKFIELVV